MYNFNDKISNGNGLQGLTPREYWSILINISSKKNPFVRGFTLTICHFETGLFEKSEKNPVVPGTRAVWNWAIGGVNLLMRDYIVNQLLMTSQASCKNIYY